MKNNSTLTALVFMIFNIEGPYLALVT